MTPELFQDALCEEIRRLLSERKYKKPPTEELADIGLKEELEDGVTDDSIPVQIKESEPELVPMTVYAQSIPVPLSDDEDENPIPYITVQLNSGMDENVYDSKYIIKVVVIMGIWEDNRNAQGHRELLNIINLIYERFKKNPCLDDRYVYEGGFKWNIPDNGYYPYYFGAFEMNFAIPAIRREDPYC